MKIKKDKKPNKNTQKIKIKKYNKKNKKNTRKNLTKKIKGGVLRKGNKIGRGSFKNAFQIVSELPFDDNNNSITRKIEENPSQFIYMEELHYGDITPEELEIHKKFAEEDIKIAPKIYENISMKMQPFKRNHDGSILKKKSFVTEYCRSLEDIARSYNKTFNNNFQIIFNTCSIYFDKLLENGYVYWDIKLSNFCALQLQEIRFIDFDTQFCYNIDEKIKEAENLDNTYIIEIKNNLKKMMITIFIVMLLNWNVNLLDRTNRFFLVNKFKEYFGEDYYDNTNVYDLLIEMNNLYTFLWSDDNWSPLSILYFYIIDNRVSPYSKVQLNSDEGNNDVEELSLKIEYIIHNAENFKKTIKSPLTTDNLKETDLHPNLLNFLDS